MTDGIQFEPEQAVAIYRRVIAQLNAAESEVDKHELRSMAMKMRLEWKAWQGEDGLHEMAFGPPD